MRQSLFALLVPTVLIAELMLGCEGAAEREQSRPKVKAAAKDKAGESKNTAGKSKKAAIGKNVFLEVLPNKKRRVLVSAEVCLREGQLELLLCRKQTKEHEAILSADVDARRSTLP